MITGYKYRMKNRLINDFDEEKSKLTEKLSQQYSHNKISLEEYERLIEYIHKTETGKELAIIGKIIEENDLMNIIEINTMRNDRRIKNHYTILSSQKTSGSIINETNKFISILGDNHITINDNDLMENETVIYINSILGETVIHVPENITVINKTIPILGGVWIDGKINNGKWDGKKKLIIYGNAILGNITVKMKNKIGTVIEKAYNLFFGDGQ
jgi:hypothetical protein